MSMLNDVLHKTSSEQTDVSVWRSQMSLTITDTWSSVVIACNAVLQLARPAPAMSRSTIFLAFCLQATLFAVNSGAYDTS